MRRFSYTKMIIMILLLSCLTTALYAQYPEFYSQSEIKEHTGESDIILYLGPSPNIYYGLINFIKSATNTLDICVYNLDIPAVAQEILNADERGVKVRLSIYSKCAPDERAPVARLFKKMKKKKILKYAKNKSALMHNKFMIADERRVWTGSYNFTKSGSNLNDNNALVLESSLLAENFASEFNEIWNIKFGKRNSTPTPHPELMIGNVRVKTFFSPEDDLETAIIEEINAATNQISILAFSYTSDLISEALKERMTNGVRVQIMLDDTLAVHFSSQAILADLKEAGADVRISPNGNQMHHKVIVIDARTVVTGSANFSTSAFQKNDENTLIIASPPLAGAMLKEFTRCWLARSYMWNKWDRTIE